MRYWSVAGTRASHGDSQTNSHGASAAERRSMLTLEGALMWISTVPSAAGAGVAGAGAASAGAGVPVSPAGAGVAPVAGGVEGAAGAAAAGGAVGAVAGGG